MRFWNRFWTIKKPLTMRSLFHNYDDYFNHYDFQGENNKRNIVVDGMEEHGDVDGEFERSDMIVEHEYETPAQEQCMMETFRTYTYLDHNGRLCVVSSTQVPFHVRRILSRALQIPQTKIRVIKPRIGGGFGAKQTVVSEFYPAIVTLKTGRAAKMIYTRKEAFTASNSRHQCVSGLRLVQIWMEQFGQSSCVHCPIRGLTVNTEQQPLDFWT